LTLKAYRSPEIPLPRVNGSPRVADFGSQGTAGSPILLPPPRQTGLKSSYKASQPHPKLSYTRTQSKTKTKRAGGCKTVNREVFDTLTPHRDQTAEGTHTEVASRLRSTMLFWQLRWVVRLAGNFEWLDFRGRSDHKFRLSKDNGFTTTI